MQNSIWYKDKDIKRYWANIIVDNRDECWLWQRNPTTLGYGQLFISGKNWLAHRFGWVLANKDDIPKGHYIRHTCKVKMCQNPRHLYLSDSNYDKTMPQERVDRILESCKWYSHSQETRDKISKRLSGIKRTPEQIENMREQTKRLWKEGKLSTHGIGKDGVRNDLGVYMRSRWEANYARLLTYWGMEWEYEPRRFDTPYGSYCPDFYLPCMDFYIEVKGFELDGTQARKRQWLIDNHIISLHLVKDKEYRRFKNEYQAQIPEWE